MLAFTKSVKIVQSCVTLVWAMCLLMLLAVQESSAASHKCHFRVRYFDRVLTFPYKSVLMVDLALKAIRCAGSDPPGPSANAASSNGTRNLNMQFHATVVGCSPPRRSWRLF